jgi:hypothetical protein
MIRIKDVSPRTCCPECGSKQLGILSCSKEDLVKVLDKKGRAVGRSERVILEQAEETAGLYKKYGVATGHVLAGRRIRTIDAEDILRRQDKVSDRLYELIMEAERSSMRRRFV